MFSSEDYYLGFRLLEELTSNEGDIWKKNVFFVVFVLRERASSVSCHLRDEYKKDRERVNAIF